MYVRLAFAVAAHLEPEILVVDEVLAVGDAQFQKKCLGKMNEVSKQQGRTVLFVSHNMGAISELCSSAIVLSGGTQYYEGGVVSAISCYLGSLSRELMAETDLRNWSTRTGSRAALIVSARLFWRGRQVGGSCPAMGDDLLLEFEVEKGLDVAARELRLSVAIRTVTGVKVIHVCNEDSSFVFPERNAGVVIRVAFPELKLYPGIYTISLWVGSAQYVDYDYVQDCLSFQVVQGDFLPRNFKTDWSQGVIFHESHWGI
jgi:lipopolysaccharide transport system ATP-binding protein